MTMKLRAKKNLKHDDGTTSFTKDREYESKNYQEWHHSFIPVDTMLTNNQGMAHIVGSGWTKHFEIIT